ncbi:MAG TPA: DNA-binding domain-containing protein [Polyangiaceae bacterium]|nr:DNA-binding domain-containing protein [Polyangiaceae bacterium]
MNATLHQLQSWLFERVTQAASEDAGSRGAELRERVVSGRWPAAERVEVYRHGYFARLVECLEDDYPALAHALGAQRFEALARDFILLHPPPSASLNYYGAPLAEYCRRRPERWSDFAAELAGLEWAVVEAIHAEEGERLDIEALGRLSPEQWSVLRLVPSPALRLLFSAYPVADYYQAFKDGSAAALATEASAAPLLQSASAVAVCRRGEDVWRIPLSVALGQLLGSLIAGTPLLEALDSVGSVGSAVTEAAIAPEELQRAFRDWVSCGLFSRVA